MSSYTSFGQSIAVTGVNLGFPGGVSRFGDRVIAARVFQPFTTTNVLNFGDPTVLIENATGGQWDSVADFIAHATSNIGLLAAQFAGMAVREVKQQITYPYNQTPGVQVLQNYGSGQMAEVLERGNGTVNFAVNNSGVAGGQVYTRVVLNSGITAGLVGDWEAGTPDATDVFSVATTTTEGSTAATVASGTNIQVGMLISGPSIAPGTYVAAITGTALTLSKAAIATFATTGNVLTFSNLFAIPNCTLRTGKQDANGVMEITFNVRNVA